MSPVRYKRLLNDIIKRPVSAGNIAQLLPFVDPNALQTFLEEQIKHFDDNTARRAYYSSASIIKIFPNDIMQHIISFDPTAKNVSKQWNSYINKAIKLNTKERAHFADKQPFNPMVPYNNESNKTFIIDQNRKSLTQKEKDLGYNGPFASIDDGIQNCEFGDILLIHEGKYELNENIIKSIQLIGIGKNVLISSSWEVYIGEYGIPKCNVYIENMTIEAIPQESVIYLCNTNLWMKDCKVRSKGPSPDEEVGITVRDSSNLTVKNCIFSNGIMISPIKCNVMVYGCTFKQSMNICGDISAAIEVFDNYGDVNFKYTDKFPFCSLKCIGNIFEKNVKYPITIRDGKDIHSMFVYQLLDHIVLKHNLFQKIKGNKLFNKGNISLAETQD